MRPATTSIALDHDDAPDVRRADTAAAKVRANVPASASLSASCSDLQSGMPGSSSSLQSSAITMPMWAQVLISGHPRNFPAYDSYPLADSRIRCSHCPQNWPQGDKSWAALDRAHRRLQSEHDTFVDGVGEFLDLSRRTKLKRQDELCKEYQKQVYEPVQRSIDDQLTLRRWLECSIADPVHAPHSQYVPTPAPRVTDYASQRAYDFVAKARGL